VRPQSAIACGAPARPAFQRLLDFLIAGKLIPIRLVYALRDFLNLPLVQGHEFAELHFLGEASRYAAPKRTDTSFDTPGSCMVTP